MRVLNLIQITTSFIRLDQNKTLPLILHHFSGSCQYFFTNSVVSCSVCSDSEGLKRLLGVLCELRLWLSVFCLFVTKVLYCIYCRSELRFFHTNSLSWSFFQSCSQTFPWKLEFSKISWFIKHSEFLSFFRTKTKLSFWTTPHSTVFTPLNFIAVQNCSHGNL